MSTKKAVVNKLTNLLIVPVLEQDGAVGYKTMKSTMIAELARIHGISIPVVIKDLKVSHDNESWSERQYKLKGQLLPIDGSNTPEVFGIKLKSEYVPVLVTGSRKSRVIFIECTLAEKVKQLFTSPEEMMSYGKAVSSEFDCHGLWELNGVTVTVVPDRGTELYRDGIGELSADLLEEMGGLAPMIQFRGVRAGLSRPAIAKGCLKLNADLPERTIVLTEGQIKGAGSINDWNGTQDLWLGVLRSYKKPGKVKESWTSIEIPANHKVKSAEVEPAVQMCTQLMEVVADPVKAAHYKGLFGRDEGFSMLDQMLRIAAGVPKNSKLPPLTRHPYVKLGLQDLMAAKLRELAVDGVTKWDYLVNTGTIMTGDERAIKTNLFPVGTRLVVRRFPILLCDSYGVVVGPSEHDQEVLVGPKIAEELMADHDGDQLGLIKCPYRYAATVTARQSQVKAITKTHQRLNSTFWEADSVIARNVGSSGVGSCTYAMLSAIIAGKDQLAEEMGVELQAAVDSLKWSCRGDVKRAREVLNEYGLPSHIAHRNDKKQFKRPETTDSYDSILWNKVAETYRSKAAGIIDDNLPLSAYGSIFGNKSHGLNQSEYRHLVDIYRWYCSRVKIVTQFNDDVCRQEKMSELFETLRAWSADKDQRWVCAAWMLCHGQSSKQNRAVFVFEVFGQRLLELLIGTYKSEGVRAAKCTDDYREYVQVDNVSGLGSLLIRTGVPLQIDPVGYHELEEDKRSSLQTVAIVALENMAAVDVAEIIKAKAYVLKANHSREIPGLNTCGVDLFHGGARVAQVADSDVLLVERMKGCSLKDMEVLAYNKSIKVIMS
jgi:hypothetical protein